MISNIIIATTTVLAIAVTFTTLFQLTLFLSSFSRLAENENKTFSDANSGDDVLDAVWSSIVDITLVIIFILQHSFAVTPLKRLMSLINAHYLQRIVYNLFTSFVLQALMLFWQPIPTYVLWNIKLEENPAIIERFFFVLHISCWLLLYIMAIPLDITEIFGIKWVYYNLMLRLRMRAKTRISSLDSSSTINKNSFNDNCSEEFYNLKDSIQHPGLICLVIILWLYPVMRLDRLFLAVIWTIYMALAWDVDDNDINYVVEQRQKKFIST